MATKVKICGISDKEDYITCLNAGAVWVGMVHYPKSPRHLGLEKLIELAEYCKGLDGFLPTRVLLTVDLGLDLLQPIIRAAQPEMLQLHGNEEPKEVEKIKGYFGLPIIKAIPIETADDLKNCTKWSGIADWLLFDTKTESGASPGGTGHSFDWSILTSYKSETPWILAGGLDADNVKKALKISKAHAVDVSSGVESSSGKKDTAKIQHFIRSAQLV